MTLNKKLKGLICLGLSAAIVFTTAGQTVLSTTMSTESSLAGLNATLETYCDNKQAGTVAPITTDTVTGAGGEAAAVSEAAIDVVPEEDAQEEEPEKKKSRYENTGISIAEEYVNIRKKPTTKSDVVGKLYQGSAVKITERKGRWVKIYSGRVEGYIKKDYLAIGKKVEKIAKRYGTKYAKVQTETLNVREKRNTKSTIVALVPEDETYLVKKETKNWAKIEVDEGTTGYVSKDYVKVYYRFKKAVSIEEEEAEAKRKAAAEAAAAEAEKEAQQRAAQAQQSHQSSGSRRSKTTIRSQRSSSSSKSSSSRRSSSSSSSSASAQATGSGSGSSVASYALNFVGNPYVYGGTSLTNGADCSGFTMSVYRKFGVSLPHGSGAQAGCGRKVSLSQAKAGDLVFYANGGGIHHVALYIGGGRIVHAKGRAYGICTDSVNYNKVYCVRRVMG